MADRLLLWYSLQPGRAVQLASAAPASSGKTAKTHAPAAKLLPTHPKETPTLSQAQEHLRKVEEQRAELEVARREAEEDVRREQARLHPEEQGKLSARVPLSHVLKGKDEGVHWIGSVVTVAGWARTMRLQEKDTLAFIELSDGTAQGTLQVVVKNSISNWTEILESITLGASLIAVGEIIKSPAQGQVIELAAQRVSLLGKCPSDYPIAKSRQALTLEYLRTIQHLRPRTNTFAAAARLRNCLASATHEFFQSRGFLYFNAPLITASDCEGAGEMFCVTTLLADKGRPIAPKMAKDLKTVDYEKDFFGRAAFLTVSGQLEAETHACCLSNVYTFGPTFRAEDSNTPRHLAEFWMIEPEVAFADITENMALAEAFIKYVLRAALERCANEMKFFEEAEQRMLAEKAKKGEKVADKEWKSNPLRERMRVVVEEPFVRITYTEAVATCEKAVREGHKFEKPCPKWGDDLNSEHERYIAEKIYARPVIVTNYPRDLKAFYMRQNDDGKTVAAMDVLVPGVGEIIGGSQREERMDRLVDRMKALHMNPEAVQWYIDLRKYGSVPHAGFGAGFERLVCYASGLENIRDVIPFPRYPGHAEY